MLPAAEVPWRRRAPAGPSWLLERMAAEQHNRNGSGEAGSHRKKAPKEPGYDLNLRDVVEKQFRSQEVP